MRHMPRRGAQIDCLLTYINHTVDPPRPVFGPRVKLHPNTRWPAAIWLVITVTMARHLIDIPEEIITAQNARALVYFLTDFPSWADTIDRALDKVGYAIDYATERLA